MTEAEKQAALLAAEALALAMPYVERGELVPSQVHTDIRTIIYPEPDGHALMAGPMFASDVAIKHLSKHFLHSSLPNAAKVTVRTLDSLKPADLAGFGQQAYEDGAKAVVLLTDAMVGSGHVDWSAHFGEPKDVIIAFIAVLFALLVSLATRYRKPWEWAALQLCREINTVTPRAS